MNLTRRDGSPLWPHRHPLVIAEFGVSHCGNSVSLRRALPRYVCAGAYKFQYHVASLEMLPGHKLYDTIRDLEIPLHDLRGAFQESRERGLLVACTTFSPDTLAELLPLLDAGELDFIKIGSGENDNPVMLDMAARSGHPTVVSLGMGGSAEVVESFGFREGGLAFLACVSEYPSKAGGCVRVDDLPEDRPRGYSSHVAPGDAEGEAVCASSLGAEILEFHVRVSPESPDLAVELGPEEFESVCSAAREEVERHYRESAEMAVASWARHVFVARRRIEAGEVVSLTDLTTRRASR